MAQKADYSLDYYSLNDVFFGRVNAVQRIQKVETPAPKEKTHKSHTKPSSFLSFGRRSTSSRTSARTEGNEKMHSETSSICS